LVDDFKMQPSQNIYKATYRKTVLQVQTCGTSKKEGTSGTFSRILKYGLTQFFNVGV
jgi:hypothetical protein